MGRVEAAYQGEALEVDRGFYQRLADGKRELVDAFEIPVRSGRAWEVPHGHLCRLVTVQGPQVGDFNVWNRHDPRERLWAARTRQLAPDLHEALQQVAEQGWSHVVLDGKVFRTTRCAETTTTSTTGETINAWYSGKHRAPGGNVQALMRPDGLPIWLSEVAPGHRHDLTCARDAGLLGALYWSASQLDLPTLADSGYEGTGCGIHTSIKQPEGGQVLAPDNQAYSTLLRSVRCLGDRGFALLTGRWRALRRITTSPRRIGAYAKAALVLTHIEQLQLRTSC